MTACRTVAKYIGVQLLEYSTEVTDVLMFPAFISLYALYFFLLAKEMAKSLSYFEHFFHCKPASAGPSCLVPFRPAAQVHSQLLDDILASLHIHSV